MEKEVRKRNFEKEREWAKNWYYKDLDKTRKLNAAKARKYRTTGKGKANARKGIKNFRSRLKLDSKKHSHYKFIANLRDRIKTVMKIDFKSKKEKVGKGSDLFGCTYRELKNHIENLFKKGMTWKNYGKWHVDHIRPVSKFNLKNRKERNDAFHYSNLQPLWARENLKKSDKV